MIKIQGTNQIHVAKQKNKNIRIFVDLDGVICNWLKGCCEVCGIDEKSKEFRDETKAGKEVPEIKSNNLTDTQMWNKIVEIGSDWWRNLPALPWADELYCTLRDLSDDVAFLSSPGSLQQFPESVSLACKGKMEWISDYFPDAKVILSHSKYLCATPNSILIDDSQKKIDKFIEYGGKAFLWPNQYKLMDGNVDLDKTLEELEEQIEKMK